MTEPELISFPSAHDFSTTLDRLSAAITARNITIFARIDHAAGAVSVGLTLRPTTVLIFGNPKAGTALMQLAQTTGIDLPLKMLVWEDGAGKVQISYVEPAVIAARHHVQDLAHLTEEHAPAARTGFREQLELYRKSLPEHVRVLFNRYRLCDFAAKVVGIGSVGTYCAIALFVAADDDPLFLQIKEARPSVLEPYAGKSLHENDGERVVAGQRLMQSASDIFLGWLRAARGHDAYVRQLRDVKVSPLIEDWDSDVLHEHGKLCAWALAKAHARSGDPAMIAGYMGSSAAFDDAICEFAAEYADQTQRDYRAFVKAVREGRLQAIV
jgi:uncharacterized protein (DUF302 family)